MRRSISFFANDSKFMILKCEKVHFDLIRICLIPYNRRIQKLNFKQPEFWPVRVKICQLFFSDV